MKHVVLRKWVGNLVLTISAVGPQTCSHQPRHVNLNMFAKGQNYVFFNPLNPDQKILRLPWGRPLRTISYEKDGPYFNSYSIPI